MLFPGCSLSGLLSRISRPSCRVRGGLSSTSSYVYIGCGSGSLQVAVCSMFVPIFRSPDRHNASDLVIPVHMQAE